MAINLKLGARQETDPGSEGWGRSWLGWDETLSDQELWEQNRGIWALSTTRVEGERFVTLSYGGTRRIAVELRSYEEVHDATRDRNYLALVGDVLLPGDPVREALVGKPDWPDRNPVTYYASDELDSMSLSARGLHSPATRLTGVPRSTITTVDYHTGGEPFRIVADPPVAIPGDSVADRRARALGDTEGDRLRRVLCYEPRGHADMYGGFITPPDDGGAAFGVLFWHKDGFSTACGHGTIALGVWAVETGRVDSDPDGVTDVTIDVPSGRVVARVHQSGDRVTAVDFVNVPSYLITRDLTVETSRGTVRADLAFGGAIYAHVRAADVGLAVEPGRINELIAFGREVKWLLNDSEHAQHPSDTRLSGVYGTILYDELGADTDSVHQRNVTIFADGEVDRSPCGSGSASRVAALIARGALRPGQTLVHDSVVGSRFDCTVVDQVTADGHEAVVPQVTGMAYRTGRSEFTVDPHDPLVPGFVLR